MRRDSIGLALIVFGAMMGESKSLVIPLTMMAVGCLLMLSGMLREE